MIQVIVMVFSIGTFHILVYGYSAVHNLSIVARGPTLLRSLTIGTPITGLGGASRDNAYFKLTIPSVPPNNVNSPQSLVITTSGGSGDPDLYVKHNSKPTKTSYDLKSSRSGSMETVSISSVQTGESFIVQTGKALNSCTIRPVVFQKHVEWFTGHLV